MIAACTTDTGDGTSAAAWIEPVASFETALRGSGRSDVSARRASTLAVVERPALSVTSSASMRATCCARSVSTLDVRTSKGRNLATPTVARDPVIAPHDAAITIAADIWLNGLARNRESQANFLGSAGAACSHNG